MIIIITIMIMTKIVILVIRIIVKTTIMIIAKMMRIRIRRQMRIRIQIMIIANMTPIINIMLISFVRGIHSYSTGSRSQGKRMGNTY